MSWHRAAVRKVRGVWHAIASLVDQQSDQTCPPKRYPESPATPIRPAPHGVAFFPVRQSMPHAPLPRCSEPAPETQKQKNGPNCNFFAIRDCCVAPDRRPGHKNAGNQAQKGPISALRDRVPIAGVRAPCQKKVRPPPRIVVTTHRQDRRRPHGHFNRTGDRARGRPAQAGRQHRPE